MPVRQAVLSESASAAYQNHSYEYLVLSWLLQGGWEASKPSVDVGAKTDVQIADGKTLYRIQVKSLASADEQIWVENKWQDADIDYVVYFSRSADWGYIVPAFRQPKQRLNAEGQVRFHQHPKHFLKAFKKI